MARANSPTAMVPAPGRAVLEKPTTRAPRITRSQGPMPRAGTSAASSGMVSEPISGVHPLAGRSADGVRLRPTPSSWRTPWTPSSTKSSHEEHEGREAKSKAARALLADSEHPDVDGEPTAGQGAGPMALTENTARHEASKTVRLRSRDNQVVQVADERDRDFLELADEFIMNARHPRRSEQEASAPPLQLSPGGAPTRPVIRIGAPHHAQAQPEVS